MTSQRNTTPPYASSSTSASNLVNTAPQGVAPPSPVALSAPYVLVDDGVGNSEAASAERLSTISSSSSQPSFHRGVPQMSNSVQEAWDPREEIFVTRPGTWYNDEVQYTGPLENKEKEKERLEREKEIMLASTRNPVSHWRISKKSVIGRHHFTKTYVHGLIHPAFQTSHFRRTYALLLLFLRMDA